MGYLTDGCGGWEVKKDEGLACSQHSNIIPIDRFLSALPAPRAVFNPTAAQAARPARLRKAGSLAWPGPVELSKERASAADDDDDRPNARVQDEDDALAASTSFKFKRVEYQSFAAVGRQEDDLIW